MIYIFQFHKSTTEKVLSYGWFILQLIPFEFLPTQLYLSEICPPNHCTDATEQCESDGSGGWQCVCKKGYERSGKPCEGLCYLCLFLG